MLNCWLSHALELSMEPGQFYSGARKIIRGRMLTFDEIENDLHLSDCGFTKSKMTMLVKGYVHEESIAVAAQLWERRKNQRKYGSVGFTCYNHFIKTDPNKKSKRASVMGPCIQAVTLTFLDDRTTAVDVFYRTTEFFKKFPADLVMIRDVLLPRFDFEGAPISEMNFHFANITCHPMYFVTLLPLFGDPVHELDCIKKADRYFFDWVVKWTARYLCDEHHRGIAKFSQALRVQKDARSRLSPRNARILADYLRENHPGYRGEYQDEDLQDV